MLNPEFRWLDPDPEQLTRWRQLGMASVPDGYNLNCLAAGEMSNLDDITGRMAMILAEPGIHPIREVWQALQTVAVDQAAGLPQPGFLNWPASLLETWLADYGEPCVALIGVLDGEGIWAGALAGISRGNLDFFTTFNLLWMDEPELASRQTLDDLHTLCQAAGRRFARPAGGFFIYKDEFIRWRDALWSHELWQSFLQNHTVTECAFKR